MEIIEENDAENIKKFSSAVRKSADMKILKKLVFSKASKLKNTSSPVKITGTLMIVGDKPVLQLESASEGGIISHENVDISSVDIRVQALAGDYGQVNLITSVGDFELKRSKKGKTTLIGNIRWNEAPKSSSKPEIRAHNREKAYILNGSEEFLKGLGISDKNGRVHDKKRAKFRQINRFLELVRDVEDKILPQLEKSGESLRICDLCCGKSYLSYAVYYYFSSVKKINVIMTGVDLKKEIIDYCGALAANLGFENLTFICSDISEYQPDPERKPHMVISLHACDTASDIVLQKAAEWETGVILSTPCCHRELADNIACDELKFITDYSMLRQKMCDAATDALRLLRLRAMGYDCEALELIDPEDTPKNIMLRAVKRKNFGSNSQEAEKLKAEYNRSVLYLLSSNQDLKGIKML